MRIHHAAAWAVLLCLFAAPGWAGADDVEEARPRDAYLRGYVIGVLTDTSVPADIVIEVTDGTVYLDAAAPPDVRRMVEERLRQIDDVRRIVWHMRDRSFAGSWMDRDDAIAAKEDASALLSPAYARTG